MSEQIYTFHRKDGFYPLVLKDDADALANAKCNPGTLKVVNEITHVVVFDADLAKLAQKGEKG